MKRAEIPIPSPASQSKATPSTVVPSAKRPRRRVTAADLGLNALAVDAQGGKPRALARLLSRLRGELPRMLRGEMARRGYQLCPADVDEVVQKVLIGVWTTDLARFDERRGAFGGFIRRRLRWALVDHVRLLSRRSTNALQPTDGTRDDDPFSLLEAADRERMLLALPHLVNVALEEERVANADSDPLAAMAIQARDLEGALLKPLAAAVGRHPAALTRARQRGLLRIRERIAPTLSRSDFATWP